MWRHRRLPCDGFPLCWLRKPSGISEVCVDQAYWEGTIGSGTHAPRCGSVRVVQAWQPGNVDVSWILVDQRDDVRYELQLSKDGVQVDDLAMDRWHGANSIALVYETFTKVYTVLRNFRTFS
ncbi:hypothetical protein SprV_0702432600 [Sparganum proliferum]